MKKHIFLFLFSTFLIITNLFAQSPPEAFKYQSIVRDASGSMLQNQAVGFQFTIIQGTVNGNPVYQETFSLSTNSYGLVNLDIGLGTVISGSFSTIDWSLGPYFIETGLDVNGGTNYAIMSTNELMSVPYALYAKTSGGGPAGPPGLPGTIGPQGPSSIIQQTVLNVGDPNCPNGGLLIESGTDLDTNNVLSPSEITSSGYVCNGDDAGDNQNLTGATLTGTVLQIDIENGNSTSVDLAFLQDGTGTDDQIIQLLSFDSLTNNLTIGIESGNTVSVDMTGQQGPSGADGQDGQDGAPGLPGRTRWTRWSAWITRSRRTRWTRWSTWTTRS